MKYAIYDKAADGYLTKMEFEVGYSEHTQFECGYNEYITEAKLLDTPKEATDAIARIESCKFMDKGRFVVHSFDNALKDQYIISEAGTPTKVVDSITVDLDGNINVKYGTMLTHWSATSLEYAINRMNTLQKAKSPKYTAWCNTFDIYKVIPIIDERLRGHYQFIKVTERGLAEYSKEEINPLNKRIEELEKTNYEFDKRLESRATLVNDLRVENTNLKNKVESIKKEACDWKKLYENANTDRVKLKNAIDTIYTDLKSTSAYCDKSYRLKAALDDFKYDDALDRISMPTEVCYIQNNVTYLTAKDEICAIIDQILTIIESHERNKKTVHASEEIPKAIANDIITICEADDKFEVTLKKFSQLYESIWIPGDSDDVITCAFESVLLILSKVESNLTNVMDENVTWKNKAQKAEKDLLDQKRLNKINSDTIARMVVEKRAMEKELSDAADALGEWKRKCKAKDKDYEILKNKLKACEIILDRTHDLLTKTAEERDKAMDYCINDVKLSTEIQKYTSIRDSLAEVIFAIRNAIYHNDSDAFCCIENRMKFDKDFNSDPFMAGVRENIEGICAAEKKNIANHELKNNEIAKLTKELDITKRVANSTYGMIIPCRCNGKQGLRDMLYDVTTGMKILVDKEKYDSLVECVNNISLTYEMMKLTPLSMDYPTWLPGVINRINDLTK